MSKTLTEERKHCKTQSNRWKTNWLPGCRPGWCPGWRWAQRGRVRWLRCWLYSSCCTAWLSDRGGRWWWGRGSSASPPLCSTSGFWTGESLRSDTKRHYKERKAWVRAEWWCVVLVETKRFKSHSPPSWRCPWARRSSSYDNTDSWCGCCFWKPPRSPSLTSRPSRHCRKTQRPEDNMSMTQLCLVSSSALCDVLTVWCGSRRHR